MPLPFILAGAAIAAAGTGIKKGLDAKEKNNRAEEIVDEAEEKFEKAVQKLQRENDILKEELNNYGEFKVDIYKNVIGDFLKLMSECSKKATSEGEIRKYLTKDDIVELEKENIEAIELSSSLAEGTASGALAAFGVYGSVGTLATASTGTSIASLSGVAATNATLAWLGGGSIATGGFGIAGGTAVLGGIVAGPAIAIAGFMADSKAEKNLTKAKKFRAKVEEKIETINYSIKEFHIIEEYIEESKYVIEELINKYVDISNKLFKEQEKIYNNLYKRYLKNKSSFENPNIFLKILISLKFLKKQKKPVKPPLCQLKNFEILIKIIASLKKVLTSPLIDENGNKNEKFIEIVENIKLEYKG